MNLLDLPFSSPALLLFCNIKWYPQPPGFCNNDLWGKCNMDPFWLGEKAVLWFFPCALAQAPAQKTMFEQLWVNSGRSLARKDPKLQILGTD